MWPKKKKSLHTHWMAATHPLKKREPQKISFLANIENWSPCVLWARTQNGAATMGNSINVSEKLKI